MRASLTQERFNRIDTATRIRDMISITIAHWCNERRLSISENISIAQNLKEKIDWLIGGYKLAIVYEKSKQLKAVAEQSGYRVIMIDRDNYLLVLHLINESIKHITKK